MVLYSYLTRCLAFEARIRLEVNTGSVGGALWATAPRNEAAPEAYPCLNGYSELRLICDKAKRATSGRFSRWKQKEPE